MLVPFVPELLYQYLAFCLILVLLILSFFVYLKYKKTIQSTMWSLILLGFFSLFLYQVTWIYYATMAGITAWVNPISPDFFWLLAFLLFGAGALNYYFSFKKRLLHTKPIIDIFLVILSSTTILFLSLILMKPHSAYYVFFSLNFSFSFFMFSSFIPLTMLFRGGKLETYWRYFVFGGFLFFVRNIFFTVEKLLKISIIFKDIFSALAFVFVLMCFMRIFSVQKSVK